MRDKKTKMSEREILAKNLRRYRQVKGLTQKDLAEKVSLAKDTISLIELGKQSNPGMKSLILISRALDIELFQLFMEDPESLTIKLIVSDQNLRSLERLFDEIVKGLDGRQLKIEFIK